MVGDCHLVVFADSVTYLPPSPPQDPHQLPPGIARYGPGVPVAPQPPAKKKTSPWLWVGLAVFGVFCVIPMIVGMVQAIVNPDSKSSSSDRPADKPAAAAETTPVVTTAASPTPTLSPDPPPPPPAPAGPKTSFEAGMYEVGVDIKAGTYTCKPDAGSSMYWERAKDATGEFGSIIANDNVRSGAQAIVTVKAKEFFTVNRGSCVIR